MTPRATKEEMLQYFTQLNKEEQQSLLGLVKTFLHSRKNPGPQTFQEYNDELEQGNAEIESGNFISHKEVTKMFSK